MDGSRFDAWTRSLATRHAALGGLIAALAPFAGTAKSKNRNPDQPTPERSNAARYVANGQHRGKGAGKRGKPDVPCAKCCSKHATPRTQRPQRCSSKPNTEKWANNAQYRGGQCTGGSCDPGLTLCQPDGCVDL